MSHQSLERLIAESDLESIPFECLVEDTCDSDGGSNGPVAILRCTVEGREDDAGFHCRLECGENGLIPAEGSIWCSVPDFEAVDEGSSTVLWFGEMWLRFYLGSNIQSFW